jgi:hypothetical protein
MRRPQGRKPVFIGLGGHGGAEEEAVRGRITIMNSGGDKS